MESDTQKWLNERASLINRLQFVDKQLERLMQQVVRVEPVERNFTLIQGGDTA